MTRTFRHLVAALALLAGACTHGANLLPFPSYHVGETARVDVITPFPLVVVDPEKTAELKLKETQRVPAVYRWETNLADQCVARSQETFITERVRFVTALVEKFKKARLDERAVNGATFRKFVTDCQGTNNAFALTLKMAKLWATNGDDSEFLATLHERLAAAAGKYIRPDDLPAEHLIGWQTKLVIASDTNEITVADAEKSKVSPRRNDIVPISKLRTDFPKQFSQDEKAAARYAASLLQPNCFPLEVVTREWRNKRTHDIWSVSNFAGGDTIIRAGEVVTPLAKAALDELRVRALALQAQQKTPTSPMPFAIGAALVAVVVGIGFWRIRQRRAATMALQLGSLPSENADPVLRAQILQRLTRLFGQTFVQRLFADRNHLLEAQSGAVAATQEVEERIENIQHQVQQRYHAYEQRIAELEAELAAAAEESRDLIRAKIVLAKQELESERTRARQSWN